MKGSTYSDREIIDGVATGTTDGSVRSTLEERNASSELSDLSLLFL